MNSGGGRTDSTEWQKPPSRKESDNSPDENPFIAFRRYADEQISSLLQSMLGLPSAVFTPANRDWRVFNDPELNNAVGRWRHAREDGCDCSNGHGSRGRSDGSKSGGREQNNFRDHSYPADSAHDSDRGSHHRFASHAFPSSVFDSMFDSHFAFGPSSFFRDFAHLHAPFMFDFLAPSTSACWPVPYLLFSPYSPLHLERQQQIRHRASDHTLIGLFAPLVSSSSSSSSSKTEESRWRDAFEDLLRLENGKEMLNRDFTVAKKNESGKDWLAGMINRGSMGDGWAHVRSPNGDQGDYFKFTLDDRRDEDERARGPGAPGDNISELDIYDSFLRQVNGDFDDEEDELMSASPSLRAILEDRERNRRELEKLRMRSEEGHERRAAVRRELSRRRLDPVNQDQPEDVVNMEPQAAPLEASEKTSSKLVSTTTKTERRTLSDGSTRTKTIVNKRFSDGREESFETEEVTDSNHNRVASENSVPSAGSADETDSSQAQQKSGWFWKE